MIAADPLLADFPAAAPARPAWLVTLADLGLLLVGFFVLLQAHQSGDRAAIARALHATFGGRPAAQPDPGMAAAAAAAAQQPLPLSMAMLDGFAPGDSNLPGPPDALIGWARGQLGDDRTILTITGATDGSDRDVDPATGSAAVLAAERARVVAVALARALPGVRLSIAIAGEGSHRRAVQVSLGFAGKRQAVAGHAAGATALPPTHHQTTVQPGVSR